MKVSVILPSINRIAILGKCLDNLIPNIIGYNYEIILVTEDPETAKFIDTNYKDNRMIMAWSDERRGYMRSFNDGLKYISDDHGIIFPIGDDGILTGGALDRVMAVHQIKLDGYGVAGFNDGYIPPSLVVTHFIVDVPFIKAELGGVLLCPHYQASCADLEVNERAKRIKKLEYDDKAFLYHEHSSRDKRPFDDIDKLKVPFSESDNILFERRKIAGFPNDFPRTI